MNQLTLQAQVNRILLATFSVVVLAMGLVVFGYAQIQETWSRKQTVEELKRTVQLQIESLIPSFLLQEQREGMALILESIKLKEGLSSILVVNDPDVVSRDFPGCQVDAPVVACESGDRTAVIALIQESGRTFGYLVKAKKRNGMVSGHLVETVEVAIVILLVSFIALFGVLARLTSRKVPGALADLLHWIEADLNGRKATSPNLEFKEFEDLRKGISEILDRYEHTRDQAMIGQLTSGIMHDIKTPLASMVAATLLASEQPEQSPKRLSRLENLLRVCQARLPVVGGIIESTLDGNRDIHLEVSCDDLASTVQEAISLNSDLIHRRKADVSVLVSPGVAPTPHDPVQMTRVLTNLIKNGIEAQSGELAVLSVQIEDDANFTTIAVDDNGPGIPTAPEKVFRVFRSTKSHGSGLGLLISRRIVEAHQGTVVAKRSQRHGGARFEVRLPKAASKGLGGA